MEGDKDFIHEHPLMTTAAALTVGLLAPVGWDMLAQNGAEPKSPPTGKTPGADKTQTGKTTGNATNRDFIHENPLMTTAAALVVGLLLPIGLGMLMQNDAEKPEGTESKQPQRKKTAAGDATNRDFVHQHPFMTTAGALIMGLLLGPVALQLLAQSGTGKPAKQDRDDAGVPDQDFAQQNPFLTTAAVLGAELLTGPIAGMLQMQQDFGHTVTKIAESGKTTPESVDTSDQDLIHEHPFLTTTAALGVGLLLGPVGVKLLEQNDTSKVKDGVPEVPESNKTATGKAKPGKSDRAHANAPDRDPVHQHPFVMRAATLGGDLLAGSSVLNLLKQHATRSGPTPTRKIWFEPAMSPGRGVSPRSVHGHSTYDTGAMDMEFTRYLPGGKDVEFSFGWKKRPIETPDTEWPVDNMGFEVDRPDGKQVAFRFTRKTRPVPAGYGVSSTDGIRPGLGQATMNFVSRRPDGGEFRFTWEKVPPDSLRTGSRQLNRKADNNNEPKEAPSGAGADESQEQHPVGRELPKPVSR